MTTNEIRFYLHSYNNLKKEIQHLKESLSIYQEMDGIKAQIITDMPMSHSETSVVEQTVLQREKYIIPLVAEIETKQRVFDAIYSVYEHLREPYRTIIEMRYFITPSINDVRQPKYSWAVIAGEVNLQEQTCCKIDCNVVRNIQLKMMGK